MKEITWNDFEKVELRTGRIISAEEFPEARKPAYKLRVDFGGDIGILRSSAQITENYTIENLLGKMVVAVVNFPPKQIGSTISECLITGFPDPDGKVVLCIPDKEIASGKKLF
jgi:tRNA-binding protein